jgi:signal peptidase II
VPSDVDSHNHSRPLVRSRSGRPLLATSIVLGVVLLDQLTKWWAVRDLPGDPVHLFGDVGFVVVRNTGSAFSLFQAFTPFLAVVAIVVAVVLLRTVRKTRDTLMVVGLSLVLGGALGNLIDRLFRAPGFLEGAVVDFVHVGRFPTFNVADSAITIGAVLIVLWAIRADVRERREARSGERGAGG